jgi:type I restriction enzyme S subunit
MIQIPKPYPEYRDSGLPWLGAIPAHWDVRRNGRLFAQRNETGFEDLPILEVSLNTGVRIRDLDNAKRKQMMSDRAKYKRAVKGDIAYNMMRLWQGAVGPAPVDGLVSPAYVVARPFEEVDSRYYAYLFRTDAYMNEVNKYSRGIVTDRNRLYWDEFKQMPSSFPPTGEQRAIATFLDHHSQAGRRFIRNRRRLIEFLNEQKQAIIDRTITRGLAIGVLPKSSCVAWLGDVPDHWEVVSLRYLATKFGSGVTPRGGAAVYLEEGVPLLRSQNVHFDGLRLNGVAKISPEMHTQLSATHIRPSDVLLNITGASIGRVCAVPSDFVEGNVNQHVCIIRPRTDRIRPDYLAAYLSTAFMQREIYIEQNGASREGLALNAIRAFRVLLPPLSEQGRIMQSIQEQTRILVSANQRAELEIALIHEYRTRLIADVVTGKVDVRHLAPDVMETTKAQEPWVNAGIMDEEQDAEDLEAVEEAVHAD